MVRQSVSQSIKLESLSGVMVANKMRNDRLKFSPPCIWLWVNEEIWQNRQEFSVMQSLSYLLFETTNKHIFQWLNVSEESCNHFVWALNYVCEPLTGKKLTPTLVPLTNNLRCNYAWPLITWEANSLKRLAAVSEFDQILDISRSGEPHANALYVNASRSLWRTMVVKHAWRKDWHCCLCLHAATNYGITHCSVAYTVHVWQVCQSVWHFSVCLGSCSLDIGTKMAKTPHGSGWRLEVSRLH